MNRIYVLEIVNSVIVPIHILKHNAFNNGKFIHVKTKNKNLANSTCISSKSVTLEKSYLEIAKFLVYIF